MNAASEDIKDFIEDESTLGLVFATNLFIAQEPTSPNNCVAVFDTPGGSPQLTFDKTEIYEYPSIQVRVRNTSFTTGWDLANKIKDLLHGLSQETINSTLYSVVYCTNGPVLLDWDENNRARIIVNFNLQRR